MLAQPFRQELAARSVDLVSGQVQRAELRAGRNRAQERCQALSAQAAVRELREIEGRNRKSQRERGNKGIAEVKTNARISGVQEGGETDSIQTTDSGFSAF